MALYLMTWVVFIFTNGLSFSPKWCCMIPNNQVFLACIYFWFSPTWRWGYQLLKIIARKTLAATVAFPGAHGKQSSNVVSSQGSIKLLLMVQKSGDHPLKSRISPCFKRICIYNSWISGTINCQCLNFASNFEGEGGASGVLHINQQGGSKKQL